MSERLRLIDSGLSEKTKDLNGVQELLKKQSEGRLYPHTIPIKFAYAYLVDEGNSHLAQIVERKLPGSEEKQLEIYPELIEGTDSLDKVPSFLTAEWFNNSRFILPASTHDAKGSDFGRGVQDLTLDNKDELSARFAALKKEQKNKGDIDPESLAIEFTRLGLAFAFHYDTANALAALLAAKEVRGESRSKDVRRLFNIFEILEKRADVR